MEEELLLVFNKEIVRELLLQEDPSTDDVLVDKIWKMCMGNPWNAGILYNLPC